MTVRLITLLKRRPDLDRQAFIAHYEGHHRLIGEKVLGGYAARYVRRHLMPVDGIDQAMDYDVVLEIDFPDEATREACFAAMAAPETMAEIVADEERLFDRSRTRSFVATDRESQLPPLQS